MFVTLTDAWHTVVPPAGDRHGPLHPMLLLLTVVTGLVDAFSYLELGHVFVANMTGNVVFLAFALVGARGFSFAASALALATFVVGAMVSGRIVVHLGPRRGRILAATATVEVVVTTIAVVLAWTLPHPGVGPGRYALVALLAAGAGMQNGMARNLAVPDLNTTVLTQTIAGAAFDSRPAGGSSSRVGRRGLAAAAMFVGALLGAQTELHVARPVGLVLATVVLAVVAASAAHLSGRRPDWDRPA
jgi:uncharacterized membrane protein YoaK (UPF0700 family)